MTTEQHSYLGVQLHHKLSWEPHIDYICSKANRTLGFLQQNLQHCPNDFCNFQSLKLNTSFPNIASIVIQILSYNYTEIPKEFNKTYIFYSTHRKRDRYQLRMNRCIFL